jgi:hypothetical protein
LAAASVWKSKSAFKEGDEKSPIHKLNDKIKSYEMDLAVSNCLYKSCKFFCMPENSSSKGGCRKWMAIKTI